MAENTYQRLESGQSKAGVPLNPQLRTLLRISQALEVPVGDIMLGGAPDLTTGRRAMR